MDLHLRFFDLTVLVRTDASEVEDLCHRVFGPFLARPGPPRAKLEILSENGAWRIRDGLLDAPVESRAWVAGIAQARLLEMAGNGVEEYDLFHAAALSRRGWGLVLAGESGHGKSLLTATLLARGWRYLSDEVAALDRRSGRLAPFPKAIEIRPSGFALLPRAVARPSPRVGKLLLDERMLRGRGPSRPCLARMFVFLENPAGAKARLRDEPLRLRVSRRSDQISRNLLAVEGVRSVEWQETGSPCPVLAIHCDRRRLPAWRLDETLGRQGVLILGSSAEAAPPIDFSREPRLARLTTAQGVGRLLRCFRGRRALARRAAEQSGGFAALFLSLCQRLEGVAFHRLEVGRLEPTIRLLEEAMAPAAPGSARRPAGAPRAATPPRSSRARTIAPVPAGNSSSVADRRPPSN